MTFIMFDTIFSLTYTFINSENRFVIAHNLNTKSKTLPSSSWSLQKPESLSRSAKLLKSPSRINPFTPASNYWSERFLYHPTKTGKDGMPLLSKTTLTAFLAKAPKQTFVPGLKRVLAERAIVLAELLRIGASLSRTKRKITGQNLLGDSFSSLR